MTSPSTPPGRAEFKKPDGPLLLVMGGLIGVASVAGAGFAVAMIRDFDLRAILIAAGGLVGGLALAVGFVNSWRQPMLRVEPGRLTVPSFFGTREIAVAPGQKVGEVLATPAHGGSRAGGIDENRFVHFFALDGTGQPVLLVALHRAAPVIAEIRRALQEVAGLRVEVMPRDPGAPRPRPDMTHWQ